MTIHKQLVVQITKKYSATIGALVGNDGLNIAGGLQSVDGLPDQLDKIFYTLEFLEKEGLIRIKKNDNTQHVDIFRLPFGNDADKIPALHYYHDKLKKAYSWDVEMLPGLLHFKQQGYQTDIQLEKRQQFRQGIFIAILASVLTALLTAWFTTAPIINFWTI